MKHIEILQNSLESATTNLIKANAEIEYYAGCLVDNIKNIVEEKVIGKEYDASDILKNKDYFTSSINLNGTLKAVALNTGLYDTEISRKVVHTYSFSSSIAYMTIVFIQDPSEILSKKKYTDAEKKLLNQLKDYYRAYRGINSNTVINIGRQLRELKNGYGIVYDTSWAWDINDLLSPDFLKRKFKCGSTYLY